MLGYMKHPKSDAKDDVVSLDVQNRNISDKKDKDHGLGGLGIQKKKRMIF